MTPRPLSATDQRLVHAAWSFGYVTAAATQALAAPGQSAAAVRCRLRRLTTDGYLDRLRYAAPTGAQGLYSVGRRARRPGAPRPWRPGLGQLQHTLDVCSAVVALAAGPLPLSGWQGEAELRAWSPPGYPYPDARVFGATPAGRWSWLVEVDRGTEGRAAWQRKLSRYLAVDLTEPVLALTTTTGRARRIATLAAELGTPLVAGTLAEVLAGVDASVFDARCRRLRSLSAAATSAG